MWLKEECVHGVCIVSATGHCTTIYISLTLPPSHYGCEATAARSHF